MYRARESKHNAVMAEMTMNMIFEGCIQRLEQCKHNRLTSANPGQHVVRLVGMTTTLILNLYALVYFALTLVLVHT